MPRRSISPFVLAFSSYAAIAAAIVYIPLVGSSQSIISSAPAETTDALSFFWNGWWMQHAITTGTNPYFCDLIFAPDGAPLVFHSFDLLQSTLLASLRVIVSPAVGFNIVVAFGLLLAGLGSYLLSHYITANGGASFVGGLTFMLCPFVISKAGAGQLNMLYAGVLPIFLLALLRSLNGEKKGSWGLAAAWLFTLSTGLLNGIFAANITVIVIVWRLITKRTVRGLITTLLPMIMVSLPIAAGLAYYIISFRLSPAGEHHYSNLPEPIGYILPLGRNSAYSETLYRLGHFHRDFARFDNAVYLGLLVLPLATAGFWRARSAPVTRLLVVLTGTFLILSLGHVLLIGRTPARVFRVPIFLPFVVWRYIPGLGIIWQAGRYMVIAYCALSVGVALFAHRVRSNAALALISLCVLADYLPRLDAMRLPPVPDAFTNRSGTILDSRRVGLPMYYQTYHHRPLVGGYISRNPQPVLERYHSVPGMDCLFSGTGCDEVSDSIAVKAAAEHSISLICISPGDARSDHFSSFGFKRIYEDRYTEVWETPPR